MILLSRIRTALVSVSATYRRAERGRALAALLSAAVCLALLLPAPLASARQGGASRYVYDEAGRLRAVVSGSGEGAVYEYDAAGNVTRIRRIASDVLEILAFNPVEGAAGDLVTLVATGLGAGVSGVSFNGTAARVVAAYGNAVVAEVPAGATTGLINITTPRATANTSRPFKVVARLRVSPPGATLLPGDTLQFTASAPGADSGVRWSVNGTEGGGPAVGTITADGLYTAPASAAYLISVRATSASDPSLLGEARVHVLDPNTVQAPFAAVSVRRDPPFDLALSGGVSVRNGSVFERLPAFTVAGVSVRNGAVSESAAAYGVSVSVTTAPHVSGVSPARLTRGVTATLDVNGANLGGATSVTFIKDDGTVDTNMRANNISVNADGTALSAAVTSNTNAALGRRVVLVSTPAGESRRIDLGTNSVEVVAP